MTSNLNFSVCCYVLHSFVDLLRFSVTCLIVGLDVSAQNLTTSYLRVHSYLYPILENSQLLLSQHFCQEVLGGTPCSLCFLRHILA